MEQFKSLETAFHAAPIAIFYLKDGNIHVPNNEAQRIYNRSEQDLTGQSFIELIHEEEREMIKDYFSEVVKENGLREKCTHRIHSEAEDKRRFDLTAIKLDGTSDWDFICYQINVSERFQVKEYLEMYNEHLEDTVKIRTNELMSALEKAQVANKVKDSFLQNMSHEFRTPIHHINSFSEMGYKKAQKFLEQNHDPVIQKLQDHFGDIHNASKNLFTFILNLFDLSNLESGDTQYFYRIYNLYELVKGFEHILAGRLEAKKQSLVIDKPSDEIRIECDLAMFQKALEKVIDNAIKFSPEGSIVRVEISKVIEQPDNGTTELVKIIVNDEGIGVPEEDLEVIFEKFTQSSRSDDGSGGKGIGLAISKSIITDHQGTIRAENRQDKGLSIIIQVPCSQSDVPMDSNQSTELTDFNKITFKVL